MNEQELIVLRQRSDARRASVSRALLVLVTWLAVGSLMVIAVWLALIDIGLP